MVQASDLHLTVAERVAEHLRTEIRQGELGAGAPLRQNDIAARLGVSSTPVREAFQILERLGLVVREGRRGVRVFTPSIVDLTNGYEVRGSLESLAARLAAARVSDAEIANLGTIMERMHDDDVTQKAFLRLNAEFHATIGRISGNDRLAELIESEQSTTTSFVVFLGVDSTSAEEAHAEHAAILSTISARDPEGAAAAMAVHLHCRVTALRERLDRQSASREPAAAVDA